MSQLSISTTELEALARLMARALSDTGQSRRCADFLLAWHNAAENGGWDPADLWAVDTAIADDILVVLQVIGRNHGSYPPELGFEREIRVIWRMWRGPKGTAA